jgi:hypothetical protein
VARHVRETVYVRELCHRAPHVRVPRVGLPITSAELSRRVGKVVRYPPLAEMGEPPRREFHEALLAADDFEDLPGKWQAAILKADQSRPKLRVVSGD